MSDRKTYRKYGLVLVIVAALFLEAISLVQYFYAKKALRQEADNRAQSEMSLARLKIENVSLSVEKDTKGMAWAYSDRGKDVEGFMELVRIMMDNNPMIVNGFIAYREGFFKNEGKWYEPVLSRINGEYNLHNVGGPDHDYFNSDWYSVAAKTGDGYWSEPYFDKDGVRSMVVTYSAPVHNSNDEFIGVFGVDVELSWLQHLIASIQPYEKAFSTLVSREGQMLACPAETLAVADALHYDTTIESTGWKMGITIPEDEIYASVRQNNMIVIGLQILGLIFLMLIIQWTAVQQKKMDAISIGRERMEKELKIASGIQMSMIPKTFPPFPERHDIDMSASIVPAKEVGGDLYDFFIRDEKLFFCIGDVSGKGVPASLVMAVTRSLFRTVPIHEKSPQRIVSVMNKSMSEMNESNMFVTFFMGILDLKNGHLRYCNAGHNAPYILSDKIEKLDVIPNLPLGVMAGVDFQEQETDLKYDDAIFLYTDGLTEAENATHEQFGEARTVDAMHGRLSAQDKLDSIKAAVAGFVGDAPQSDDLTMLFIHYTNKDMSEVSEHHLVLHNDIKQISLLTRFIDNIAEDLKIDPGLAMSINLALEEAVTNVIMYAYPKDSDEVLELDAIISPGSLEFVITDSGKAFDPTAAPEADVSLDVQDRPIGGLGIYLVRNIMDTVRYERKDGRNILTMIKKY